MIMFQEIVTNLKTWWLIIIFNIKNHVLRNYYSKEVWSFQIILLFIYLFNLNIGKELKNVIFIFLHINIFRKKLIISCFYSIQFASNWLYIILFYTFVIYLLKIKIFSMISNNLSHIKHKWLWNFIWKIF